DAARASSTSTELRNAGGPGSSFTEDGDYEFLRQLDLKAANRATMHRMEQRVAAGSSQPTVQLAPVDDHRYRLAPTPQRVLKLTQPATSPGCAIPTSTSSSTLAKDRRPAGSAVAPAAIAGSQSSNYSLEG